MSFGDYSSSPGDLSTMTMRQGTLVGGVRLECGKFCFTTASKTCTIATNLREVIAGFAVSDETAYMIQGRAVSVCTASLGQVIDWSMSDSTGSVMQFVVFGY